MSDTLTGLGREIHALWFRDKPANDPEQARDLARRLDAYAESIRPWELDPDTRTNLLTKLARTLEPRCPRDPEVALRILGLTVEDQPR